MVKNSFLVEVTFKALNSLCLIFVTSYPNMDGLQCLNYAETRYARYNSDRIVFYEWHA